MTQANTPAVLLEAAKAVDACRLNIKLGVKVGFPTQYDAIAAALDKNREALAQAQAPQQDESEVVGAAELEVGRYVYKVIEARMDAKAGTVEAVELDYLTTIVAHVEEYGAEKLAVQEIASDLSLLAADPRQDEGSGAYRVGDFIGRQPVLCQHGHTDPNNLCNQCEGDEIDGPPQAASRLWADVDYLARHTTSFFRFEGGIERSFGAMRADLKQALAALALPDHAQAGALADVAAERRRQVEVEGWTPEHDDEHASGEMADAAACYAAGKCVSDLRGAEGTRFLNIWPKGWAFKASNRRRNLVKAGALIVAEIERLDREHARPAHPRELRAPGLRKRRPDRDPRPTSPTNQSEGT